MNTGLSSGIITILALAGFLAVVFWVYIMKSGKDFDAQARQPLDDEIEERQSLPGHSEMQNANHHAPNHEESQP
ncbi:MAG: cbb3-type cytochrome c oxidase subunit 3 [Pseudomonadota bacterium]